MPAAAVVGAAVLGAGATAYSVNKQKKTAKEQARQVERQEEQAKIEARERALLDAARDEGGADIKLGREKRGDVAQPTLEPVPGAATSRPHTLVSRPGGLRGDSYRSRRAKELFFGPTKGGWGL